MAWTDERIALLKELWDQGLSASQIAEKLAEGVTRNAVIGKAHRLGLASRPSPVKSAKSAKTGKKPAAKRPARPRAAKARPAKPERITLLTLTDRICKWPIGHPGEPDFHFCGRRSQPGQPYCAAHAAEAYQTPQSRRDRNKAPRPS